MTSHWASFMLTPKEIYEQITGGKGSGTLEDEQVVTDREQAREGERADLIRSLANTVKSGWQGEASEGAYGAAMPLAERAVENSVKLTKAQDLLSRQVGSFHRAVNSVQPVSDPPQMSVDEPFPFDVDHDKAVQDYQDAAQTNIAAYREYDGASHYNETNLPQEYHGNIRDGGDVSVKGPGDVIKVGEPGPGISEPRSGGPGDSGPYSGGPYPGGGPGPGGYSGGPAEEPVGPGAGPGGSQTSPNDFRPVPPAASAPYPMPTYPVPGQASPVSGGFVGGVPVGGEFGPRGGGPGGPSGGRGPGAGGPGGAVKGPLGPGAGALAAEEAAAARRAAQAAAAGGARAGVGPTGAPMGAGRNKDDEDSEHQRKVLIEADAEEMFGSDVLTAPQVIGDDEYEDD